MKRVLLLFVLQLFFLTMYSQVYKLYNTKNYHNQLRLNTMTGEVQQIQDDGQSWQICSAREVFGDKSGRFSLYETKNMWTFIMLDTYSGRTWQVQYSVKGEEYMFAEPINLYYLAIPDQNSNWSNRFQLFATKNTWTFILLDSYNGRLWQVQYSTDSFDYLLCVPINDVELVTNERRSVFSIQPLVSMYQYYLINESNGDMWKFQWSTKGDDYRWIERFK